MQSDPKNPRGLMGFHIRRKHPRGQPAGLTPADLKALPTSDTTAVITCIDYSPDQVQTQTITDIDAFVAQHRPAWATVRWINVDGFSNTKALSVLAQKYDLHPLAMEDTLHVPQRPKVETYPAQGEIHGRIFILTRMMTMKDKVLQGEQVSIFLGQKTLLTFQERPDGDVFDPIRARLQTKGSRVRNNDASFLMYCLLDAIVDNGFPILEHYSDALEDLEDEVLAKPDSSVIAKIHSLKRDLLLLRRTAWPMREAVSSLSREEHECLSPTTRTYLRDVYDHSVQILDMIETYREFASGLTETYMTAMSTRMNEIMKVLTIVSTIFVPLTFLAGVYGMNFEVLPELHFKYGYLAFWIICVILAVSMIVWFRRRKWL